MSTFKVNEICFFDSETTGIPERGLNWDEDFNAFPYVVQLAWSIGERESNYIIKPNGWTIPDDLVKIHGISTERAMAEGVEFSIAIEAFLKDAATAPLICAHNIHFDTSIIKANILREMGKEYYDEKAEDALFKGKRIDTMMKTIKFVGACYDNGRPGKFPRLEELFTKLFEGETFAAHNALEDVRALKRCVVELVKLGIIELLQKEYPA